jgi:hypothetical protein
MSEIVMKTTVPREAGFLYFVGTTKDGFLTVNKAKMSRGGRKKKAK